MMHTCFVVHETFGCRSDQPSAGNYGNFIMELNSVSQAVKSPLHPADISLQGLVLQSRSPEEANNKTNKIFACKLKLNCIVQLIKSKSLGI